MHATESKRSKFTTPKDAWGGHIAALLTQGRYDDDTNLGGVELHACENKAGFKNELYEAASADIE